MKHPTHGSQSHGLSSCYCSNQIYQISNTLHDAPQPTFSACTPPAARAATFPRDFRPLLYLRPPCRLSRNTETESPPTYFGTIPPHPGSRRPARFSGHSPMRDLKPCRASSTCKLACSHLAPSTRKRCSRPHTWLVYTSYQSWGNPGTIALKESSWYGVRYQEAQCAARWHGKISSGVQSTYCRSRRRMRILVRISGWTHGEKSNSLPERWIRTTGCRLQIRTMFRRLKWLICFPTKVHVFLCWPWAWHFGPEIWTLWRFWLRACAVILEVRKLTIFFSIGFFRFDLVKPWRCILWTKLIAKQYAWVSPQYPLCFHPYT